MCFLPASLPLQMSFSPLTDLSLDVLCLSCWACVESFSPTKVFFLLLYLFLVHIQRSHKAVKPSHINVETHTHTLWYDVWPSALGLFFLHYLWNADTLIHCSPPVVNPDSWSGWTDTYLYVRTSKEWTLELRKTLPLRHRSGKVPQTTVPSIIRKWRNFGTTRTLPKTGHSINPDKSLQLPFPPEKTAKPLNGLSDCENRIL